MIRPIPENIYSRLKEEYQDHLEKLLKKRKRYGWLRLISFISTILIAWQLFMITGAFGIIAIVSGFTILLIIVSMDLENNKAIENCRRLIQINTEETEVLGHHFQDRYDGTELAPDNHEYSNDMDLFGRFSLFQLVNRCYTEQGEKKLALNLLQGLSQDQINMRRQAVKELSMEINWRQQLQAYSMQSRISSETENKIINWLMNDRERFKKAFWKPFVTVYSFITLLSLIFTLTGYLPASAFSFLFLLYISFAGMLVRKAVQPYSSLNGIIKEIVILKHLLKWICEKKFTSELTESLQNRTSGEGRSAADEINHLQKILNRFDLLLNLFGNIFLNGFLLWGVRQMISLNHWKEQNKRLVAGWFEVIAEFEVLNSLSTICINNPDWSFPEFRTGNFLYEATGLGHPLIPADKRISNDFSLCGPPRISLITGSNMAGKSTFLRSIGINIVLAQAGAPVCARSLKLSTVKLMSSMRIEDNLAENTSTFYAELKKLKRIIDAVNRKEKIFILLDEILRGTNSLDRHTGSEALIAQLIRQQAVAVLATHDVELGQLKKNYPGSIDNYHFDVQVEGDELYFDYKLKEGICTSLNASILMKKIGIQL